MVFSLTSWRTLFSSLWGNGGKEGDKEGEHPKGDAKHEALSSSPSNGSSLPSVRPHGTKEEEHYEAYIARFPFPSVVPPPVAFFSIQGLVSLSLHCLKILFLSVAAILSCPVWLGLHVLFLYLDRRQRASWAKYREQWPHKSVPHERPLAYPTNESFPLQDWHLQCENGRQRWYYGEPLATPEEGNLLGKALSAGCTLVEEWRRYRAVGGGGGVSPGTLSQSAFPTENSAAMAPARPLSTGEVNTKEASMWARRRQLERYQLGLNEDGEPLPSVPHIRANAEEAMKDGAAFLMRLQDLFSGHWPNDYSGCMFLTSGLLIVKYILAGGAVERMFCGPIPGHQHLSFPEMPSRSTFSEEASSVEEETEEEKPARGVTPSSRSSPERTAEATPAPCRCAEATRSELIRYLRNYQNEDGGFGQHTEGHSTMLGSVLSYVSLRLLGVSKKDTAVERCRSWIRREGGAGYTPTWGKVWLSILGVYHWDGITPVPPELLLLPDWLPFSLGRSWCHSRVIAIPFSYFYGQRWSAPLWPLTAQLREELYVEPYQKIDWKKLRGACCAKDLYTPLSVVYKVASSLLNIWEKHHIPCIREKALEMCWTHMAYDDENTNFICLGPVNKSLNMLAAYIREGPSSERLRLHEARTWDYLYMNRAGMKMNGYNGSQLWDTSFAVQAICACRLQEEYTEGMKLAHHYVDIAQVTEDPIAADLFYRHRTIGAWNFSTSNQGWQVSDCTAEGLRVLLLLKSFPFPQRRLFDGVDEILSLRNVGGDGGWASYEPTRAPYYVELMNCAELFQDVMVEYSYAECSSSCVHTLSLFRQHYPWYRTKEVDIAIREGITCILQKQRENGSFYGSWAVCFTYAAWIVSSAISISGELPNMEYHPRCQSLIHFLLAHQNEDGGWGEDVNSCVRGVWTDSPDGSQVVNTAWAVMAIMNASGSPSGTTNSRRKLILEAVHRGIQLIMSRQLVSGDWTQERISGVFNGNNPIHYPGYKNCMTVWALGKYVQWEKHYTWTVPTVSSSCPPELKKLQ